MVSGGRRGQGRSLVLPCLKGESLISEFGLKTGVWDGSLSWPLTHPLQTTLRIVRLLLYGCRLSSRRQACPGSELASHGAVG